MKMKGDCRRILSIVLTVLFSLTVAACGTQQGTTGGDKQDTPSASTPAKTDTPSDAKDAATSEKKDSSMEVTIYFPNTEGTKLIAVKREVSGKDKYTAAMDALLQGPTDKGQTAILPKKTKLLDVTVAGSVAKVNFSSDIQKGFVGGSTGEEMLVGSVVDTLTEFPEVKKVQILVDGKSIESLSGHMDLTEPIARMTELLK